ncbi:MAG TPA: helix-turn-helix transcriptional regulator [Stellaceae bacterium]|jgi:transcriptional regulator with XRE-family HTH domain|nr:helix-turn-helix transcriptional regulator [Stellaceae bacterium]
MRCPHCNGTGELNAPHYGDLVHAMRRAKNMTQQDLGEKAGISRAQIANMEAGRTDIPLKTLSRIAAALECSMKDLVP